LLEWLALCLLVSAPVAALGQDLRAQSDASLTEMAGDWDNLSASDRRKLLSEVQRRMDHQRARRSAAAARRAAAQAGDPAQAREGTLRIRTERRFGRKIRQPDGSVVTISGRVVQERPATAGSGAANAAATASRPSPAAASRPSPATASRPSPATASRPRFGVGFERRSDGRRVVLVPRIVQLSPALPAPANTERAEAPLAEQVAGQPVVASEAPASKPSRLP
jgi:hypothetical protein